MLHKPFPSVLTPHAVRRVSYPTWKWSVSSLSKVGKSEIFSFPGQLSDLLKLFCWKSSSFAQGVGQFATVQGEHGVISPPPLCFIHPLLASFFSPFLYFPFSLFNLASDVHHILKWTREDNHLYVIPGFWKSLQSGSCGFAVPLAPY